MNKEKQVPLKTYTKKLTKCMIVVGCISGNIPYVLSYFDKDPVSDIGKAWILGIVAVCIGYFVRGFKDSRSEEDCKYRERCLNEI